MVARFLHRREGGAASCHFILPTGGLHTPVEPCPTRTCSGKRCSLSSAANPALPTCVTISTATDTTLFGRMPLGTWASASAMAKRPSIGRCRSVITAAPVYVLVPAPVTLLLQPANEKMARTWCRYDRPLLRRKVSVRHDA